ncbi:MAG: CocE/NonD family hydrolase [Pseudomonadota bacterium]
MERPSAQGAVSDEPLPHQVEIVPSLPVSLPDGRNLSARLWLPECAHKHPVPALVEYCPFRHADFSYPRDALIHPWFAGHGYASLRLEPAGSLDSDGPPQDEYIEREQQDGVDALAWIADQPWCSGTTGMFGMSWGAFSALQVAALRPPSLRAIIPVHGSDDRYEDDIHYMGGRMLTAGLAWGALYQTYMMRPPTRQSGAAWRKEWLARMEAAPNVLERWMSHQSNGPFWRHGSLRESYSRITAPTLLICGWADGYSNAALRMLNRLECPTRAIIGPWTHAYPHIAHPGPQMDFLGEAKAWWDRWLMGICPRADRGPKLRYYLQESVPPRPAYVRRPGRWCSAESWPPKGTSRHQLHLNKGGLASAPEPGDAPMAVSTPLDNDMLAWEWLPHGFGPEMPLDQARHDEGALVFDSEAFSSGLIVAGAPSVHLKFRTSHPDGALLIRLCELDEAGSATLLSYGFANLSATGRCAETGHSDDLTVRLTDIAQEISPGHALRLSISTNVWPIAWPAADQMTLVMQAGVGTLHLPVLDKANRCQPADIPSRAIVPAVNGVIWTRTPRRDVKLCRADEEPRITRLATRDDGAFKIHENGRSVDARGDVALSIADSAPQSARAEFSYRLCLGDNEGQVTLLSHTTITANKSSFLISQRLLANDEDETVYSYDNNFTVRRSEC